MSINATVENFFAKPTIPFFVKIYAKYDGIYHSNFQIWLRTVSFPSQNSLDHGDSAGFNTRLSKHDNTSLEVDAMTLKRSLDSFGTHSKAEKRIKACLNDPNCLVAHLLHHRYNCKRLVPMKLKLTREYNGEELQKRSHQLSFQNEKCELGSGSTARFERQFSTLLTTYGTLRNTHVCTHTHIYIYTQIDAFCH